MTAMKYIFEFIEKLYFSKFKQKKVVPILNNAVGVEVNNIYCSLLFYKTRLLPPK